MCRKKKNNDPGLSVSFSQFSVSVCICVCVCVSACVHMCDCLWLSVSPGFFFPDRPLLGVVEMKGMLGTHLTL